MVIPYIIVFGKVCVYVCVLFLHGEQRMMFTLYLDVFLLTGMLLKDPVRRISIPDIRRHP